MIEGKQCPICNESNSGNNLFCENCRYPLSVVKMDEFSREDADEILKDFLDIVKNKKSVKSEEVFDTEEERELYGELFSAYWLRPETALFNFLEARFIRRFTGKYLNYPILELGCGDGMFTSIVFGAKLNREYDNFEGIDFSKSDPFNSYSKVPNLLLKKPSKIGFGIDIKNSSINRAKDLESYDEVKTGDIRNLPFDNECVNSVYSNMVDDIKGEDLNKVLKEVHRVLKEEGFFVFTTPLENYRNYLLYYNKAKEHGKIGDKKNQEAYLKYDRGRSEWEPRPISFWKEVLNKNSFEIVDSVKYADKSLIQFWDTGFRPFFYNLVNLKNSLKERGCLKELKNLVVEIMKDYFLKFVANQETEEGSFAMIVAKKT